MLTVIYPLDKPALAEAAADALRLRFKKNRAKTSVHLLSYEKLMAWNTIVSSLAASLQAVLSVTMEGPEYLFIQAVLSTKPTHLLFMRNMLFLKTSLAECPALGRVGLQITDSTQLTLLATVLESAGLTKPGYIFHSTTLTEIIVGISVETFNLAIKRLEKAQAALNG